MATTKREPRPKRVPWPADKVERWPLAKLIPYARNARTHSEAQVKQIAGSITKWGWTMLCLVSPRGELIAGHGRALAANLLKLTEAPVMVGRGWTPEMIKAYRLADNQLALNAEWDQELLGLELAELVGRGFDLMLTGFSDVDIEALIRGPQPPGGFQSYDETIATEHECPKCGFKWSGTVNLKRQAV
jgi:ParB-like chromosome segregation protein Spo0J